MKKILKTGKAKKSYKVFSPGFQQTSVKLLEEGCVCEDLEVVCQLLVEPSTNQPTTKSDSRDQLHQSFSSSTILYCQNYKQ